MKLSPDDFLGTWQISRQITDFRMLQSGHLEGEAQFTSQDGGLYYHERGALTFAGGAPIVAERAYFWTFTDSDVFVAYNDGSTFHSFSLAAGHAATPHLCGDDLYKGTYSFTSFPEWQVTWFVKGPRKDYRSVTRYHRV